MGIPAQGDYRWHLVRAWEQVQMDDAVVSLPDVLHIEDVLHLFPVPSIFFTLSRLQLAPGGKFKEGGDWFCHKKAFTSLLMAASNEAFPNQFSPIDVGGKPGLTIIEAAKYLRKSETTIAKWVRQHVIKFKYEVKDGQQILVISRECLDDVIYRRSPLEIVLRCQHPVRCPFLFGMSPHTGRSP